MVAIKHISLSFIVMTLSLTAQSPSLSSGRVAGPPPSKAASSESAASVPADSESFIEPEGRSSLFAQSAAEALSRDFPSSDISFLLLDAHTDRVLASRWDHPDAPIPMGSLLKPFTALAY